MKQTIKFEIECGEKTCASEPGKFCRFFQVSRFGTIPSCKLFSEQGARGNWEPLEEKDGWLQRHPECIRRSKEDGN